jgi:tRNA dimethylallyltransferase
VKPLIVILGPTASGKTRIAIELAKKYNGEIICADSRTIFEYMDIGTSKPSTQERSVIPHHILDIIKPDEKFSVAEFQRLAYKKIDDILNRGKIPFLVGGTGLYIDAVTEGFIIPKIQEDRELRQRLETEDIKKLIIRLKKINPIAFRKIDLKNKRKVIRALEVCLKTDSKFSDSQKKIKSKYKILKIGISLPRKKLYEIINKRTDQMIEMGLVDEVKKLYKMGYNAEIPSLSGLIYKEIGEYVRGKITLDDAVEKAKQKTRNFAKRQITWFKRDPKIKWIKNIGQANELIFKFLKGE